MYTRECPLRGVGKDICTVLVPTLSKTLISGVRQTTAGSGTWSLWSQSSSVAPVIAVIAVKGRVPSVRMSVMSSTSLSTPSRRDGDAELMLGRSSLKAKGTLSSIPGTVDSGVSGKRPSPGSVPGWRLGPRELPGRAFLPPSVVAALGLPLGLPKGLPPVGLFWGLPAALDAGLHCSGLPRGSASRVASRVGGGAGTPSAGALLRTPLFFTLFMTLCAALM
mmetsp:Transcript_3822/g.11021  ORF Transcript_3822/g.11021 Transcript_3822/m.11021 type:complete len:221 (-) Transcript_3822:225-887(-)